VNDGCLPVADGKFVLGAGLQRQGLEVVEAGDDIGGAASQVVFDVLGFSGLEILLVERALLARVVELD